MDGQINAPDLHLSATLECGQAFRWTRATDGWFDGVVGDELWRLQQEPGGELLWERRPGRARAESIAVPVPLARPALLSATAQAAEPIRRYLALDRSLPQIVASFPAEHSLQEAVRKHWGLRVLRQEPWETLASFLASSTKQIVQIRQIVANLARCFGEPIGTQYRFPVAAVMARASLPALLGCKLGFRAKYLLAAAQAVAAGSLDLTALPRMEYKRAAEELMKLPGVGPKIANCVLLFSCGHDAAFPVDVWVARSLRRMKRDVDFGPYAGWAQQYLFYDERLSSGRGGKRATPRVGAPIPVA